MKRLVRSWALVAAFALVVTPVAFAQAEKAPDEMTGIAVGEKAPAFTLKNQAGEDVALSDLLGDGKKVALVFHRSADW